MASVSSTVNGSGVRFRSSRRLSRSRHLVRTPSDFLVGLFSCPPPPSDNVPSFPLNLSALEVMPTKASRRRAKAKQRNPQRKDGQAAAKESDKTSVPKVDDGPRVEEEDAPRTVRVTRSRFVPGHLEIERGDRVRWRYDCEADDVGGVRCAGVFESDPLKSSFDFVFTERGSYEIASTLWPRVKQSIKVVATQGLCYTESDSSFADSDDDFSDDDGEGAPFFPFAGLRAAVLADDQSSSSSSFLSHGSPEAFIALDEDRRAYLETLDGPAHVEAQPSAAGPAHVGEEAQPRVNDPPHVQEEAQSSADGPAHAQEEAQARVREEAPPSADRPAHVREETQPSADGPAHVREEAQLKVDGRGKPVREEAQPRVDRRDNHVREEAQARVDRRAHVRESRSYAPRAKPDSSKSARDEVILDDVAVDPKPAVVETDETTSKEVEEEEAGARPESFVVEDAKKKEAKAAALRRERRNNARDAKRQRVHLRRAAGIAAAAVAADAKAALALNLFLEKFEDYDDGGVPESKDVEPPLPSPPKIARAEPKNDSPPRNRRKPRFSDDGVTVRLDGRDLLRPPHARDLLRPPPPKTQNARPVLLRKTALFDAGRAEAFFKDRFDTVARALQKDGIGAFFYVFLQFLTFSTDTLPTGRKVRILLRCD